MRSIEYGLEKSSRRSNHRLLKFFIVIALLVGGYFGYSMLTKPSPQEVVNDRIVFDDSFTTIEKQKVSDAIVNQSKKISGITTAQVQTVESLVEGSVILDGYVFITAVDSPKQQITKIELSTEEIFVWHEIDSVASTSIIKTLGINDDTPEILNNLEELNTDAVAMVPIGILSKDIKLLALEGKYYLDDFASGAVFRQVTFSGDSKELLSDLNLSTLPSKETTYKVNQTGVTALTRIMMKKLNSVGDPLYFSEKIGDFLSDADLTHVSNEVSFRDDCSYSNTAFCSDPRFIETLKDSGVDLVELTGNHNNDVGSQYNTNTINLYRSLGWNVFGGGLNTEDAAKFFVTDQKQSKIAFLAYNYPDSPNGGAIANSDSAGANSFDFGKIKTDIETAKQQSQFVIVDVQYWECYAYPDGYIEFPECDLPIGEQESVFKQIADLGADMVVGSSAHQPQIYELYNGVPIYYGLGNLYFDQSQWPGTERGIILTHYFVDGYLIQTKLTPTIYDDDLQTEVMSNQEAENFLDRLQTAR